MRTKRLSELPKCNFCDKEAEYDAPTIGGRWGNMCPACFSIHASSDANIVGTKLVKGIAEAKEGKAKFAATVNIEEAFTDNRRIACPECNEERSVEPDADYEFNCEGCGIKLKCVDIMCEI